jgi:hypothetical protein
MFDYVKTLKCRFKSSRTLCLVNCYKLFYVLLTVHLDAILGNDQLDALFLNVFILFYACTCFEQQVLIIRRAKLY